MDNTALENLQEGLHTAFIDGGAVSNIAYRPTFVSNVPAEGKKVLSTVEDELLNCDRFDISVAFITMSGVTPLLQTLKELEKRNVPGRILTTNYLNFSEPKALSKLNELKNITVKMYDIGAEDAGFHTKGYIFKKEEIYRIIIGSSNMTNAALTQNKEWNTRIISTESGEMAQEIVKEFNAFWESDRALNYADFIDTYTRAYGIIKKQRELAKEDAIVSIEKYKLKPNSMQLGFIDNLSKIVDSGEDRALLISATGTGKTYASAFAMRELSFKKVLFVVHRATLARQAMASFRMVFGDKEKMGIVGAGYSGYDADFVFAMVETLHKEENLRRFKPDYFTCIILDEAHHSTAGTYRRIMEYFKPKLFLGMTATPDKREGSSDANVYELFNYQIAYEIRLKQAMEENLLCPFHYFGISDIMTLTEKEMLSDKLSEKEFCNLTSDERVKHVIEQAKYYGFSGDRVKGLIFCSRKKECEELSKKFNEKGFRTIALSGDDDEKVRQQAFERLAMDEEDATDKVKPLDYIFSVDILNEGVDIIEVNQVIMLRPTQSPIVFIQQLGRGLRKAKGKEYVVILDFIGNYTNNFMIPIALSGDRSYNKDNIRRYVAEGGRVIPGASTIHFDEISRKRIYQAIDNANFSELKLIRENYSNLKNKLGRIPKLMDFDKYGEMDPQLFFDNNSLGSYYKFLTKYEKDYTVRLSEDEELIIEFISKKLANGKRVHELELLKRLITYKHGILSVLDKSLQENYHQKMDENCKSNVVNILTNEFPAGAARNTYNQCVFLEKEGNDYKISKRFEQMLTNKDFVNVLKELLDFGISRYERNYSNSYQDTNLVLYQKYTYEDACRLLNWEHNEVPLNIGGYKYDKRTKTLPVFINYDKQGDISDTTKYEDHFLTPIILIAISKSGRSMESEDVQNFLKAGERNIDVELFVRKNKDDKVSKEFYYLGRMSATGNAKEFVMPNTDKTAVEIEWLLKTPVREDIYEYIVSK